MFSSSITALPHLVCTITVRKVAAYEYLTREAGGAGGLSSGFFGLCFNRRRRLSLRQVPDLWRNISVLSG